MDIFDSVILLYFNEYLLSVKRKNCMHKNRTNKRNIWCKAWNSSFAQMYFFLPLIWEIFSLRSIGSWVRVVIGYPLCDFLERFLMVPKSTHWGMLYVSCCKWERAWRFALSSNYFPLITMDWSCGSSTFVCLYNFLMCLSKGCCCSLQIYLQVRGISDLEPIYS